MSEKKTPVLEVKELGIDFGGLTAVNDLDMSIYNEEIVGLIGPNGAGKTTVFNLLTKVYTPTRGSIFFDGIPELFKTFGSVVKIFDGFVEAFAGKIGKVTLEFSKGFCNLVSLIRS